MSVVAKRLKDARRESAISQERLGVLAGIDEASASARMNQYERGVHIPDISMIKRLADVLNLPVPYFYADDDDIAKLLVHFHRMQQSDREKVINFVFSFPLANSAIPPA